MKDSYLFTIIKPCDTKKDFSVSFYSYEHSGGTIYVDLEAVLYCLISYLKSTFQLEDDIQPIKEDFKGFLLSRFYKRKYELESNLTKSIKAQEFCKGVGKQGIEKSLRDILNHLDRDYVYIDEKTISDTVETVVNDESFFKLLFLNQEPTDYNKKLVEQFVDNL